MRYLFTLLAICIAISTPVFARKPSSGGVETLNFPDPIEIDVPYGGDGPRRGGCGGDCRDGGPRPPPVTPVPRTPSDSPKDTSAEKKLLADKELENKAREWYLFVEEKPLENDSKILEWAFDRIKELLGKTIGIVIDVFVDSTPTGISEFDLAKNAEHIKLLRAKLELEERELKKQKEENQKTFEKNTELLFPSRPTETERLSNPASIEKQARFEDAIKARTKLESEDLYVVIDHILRRTKVDAPIPLTKASIKEISDVFLKVGPANACRVSKEFSCILQSGFRTHEKFVASPVVAQNLTCFCFDYRTKDYYGEVIKGVTVRNQVGRYCRNGTFSEDMHKILPTDVQCRVAVDITINPYNKKFDFVEGRLFVEGRVSKCSDNDIITSNPDCI